MRLANLATRKLTPYFVELKRHDALKEPGTDGGVYETKFVSHTPMDFSSWDCYKTGAGSPAIVCDLRQQPTKGESDAFVKAEREQEGQSRLEESASNYLISLDPAELIEARGKGQQTESYVSSVEQSISIKYPFADFKFQFLGMYRKDLAPTTIIM
jgi:hypothetical protein